MRSPRLRPFLAAAGLLVLATGAVACGSAATGGPGPATNVPSTDAGTTPDTTPETTPATTPDTTPDTAPATTPDTTPDTTVAGDGTVPSGLVGVVWHVEGRITVGGIVAAPAGSTAAITFAADGTVGVDTGCNSGSGTVTYSGDDQLQVSELGVTERACIDEDPASFERAILAVLAEPLVWFVEGDHLTVYPMTVTDTGLRLVAGN